VARRSLIVAIKINIPVDDPEIIVNLKAGEEVLLTGRMLTARDAAHKRLIDLLDKGEPLPVDLDGACVYYVGALRPPGPATSSAPRAPRPPVAWTHIRPSFWNGA